MDTLGPALESLLDMAEQRLIDCNRAAGLVTLAPGAEVAWDNCCEGGGELWLRVIQILPQPQTAQPCDVTDWKVSLGLGVVRCMHGLNEEGAPTAAQMTGDTLGMTKDADILFHAIQDWPGTPQVILRTLVIEAGVPLGPEGFCGGWEWILSVRLLLCSGC